MARAVVAAKIANGAAVLDAYRKHSDPAGDFDARKVKLAEASTHTMAPRTLRTGRGGGRGGAEYFSLVMQFNRSEMEWPGSSIRRRIR